MQIHLCYDEIKDSPPGWTGAGCASSIDPDRLGGPRTDVITDPNARKWKYAVFTIPPGTKKVRSCKSNP